MKNVSCALKSKKVKKQFFNTKNDEGEGLMSKGRIQYRDSLKIIIIRLDQSLRWKNYVILNVMNKVISKEIIPVKMLRENRVRIMRM